MDCGRVGGTLFFVLLLFFCIPFLFLIFCVLILIQARNIFGQVRSGGDSTRRTHRHQGKLGQAVLHPTAAHQEVSFPIFYSFPPSFCPPLSIPSMILRLTGRYERKTIGAQAAKEESMFMKKEMDNVEHPDPDDE